MYGIVNKAVKELLIEQHGETTWQQVKAKAGLPHDSFLSNEPYDDAVTYQMAGATAEVLQVPVAEVLHALGEYWILKTGLNHYRHLMEAGGENLHEFLVNLPNFHSRIMLMFPKLQPPEFLVKAHSSKKVEVHYYSQREGLMPFTMGLLNGLSKMFNEPVHITLLEEKAQGADHDVFMVTWQN